MFKEAVSYLRDFAVIISGVIFIKEWQFKRKVDKAYDQILLVINKHRANPSFVTSGSVTIDAVTMWVPDEKRKVLLGALKRLEGDREIYFDDKL